MSSAQPAKLGDNIAFTIMSWVILAHDRSLMEWVTKFQLQNLYY